MTYVDLDSDHDSYATQWEEVDPIPQESDRFALGVGLVVGLIFGMLGIIGAIWEFL